MFTLQVQFSNTIDLSQAAIILEIMKEDTASIEGNEQIAYEAIAFLCDQLIVLLDTDRRKAYTNIYRNIAKRLKGAANEIEQMFPDNQA